MNIFIIPIEPIDSRYTKQWHNNIPKLLINGAKGRGVSVGIISVDGEFSEHHATAGAILDFAVTNAWKASQVSKIAELFNNGTVKPGDRFLVTDAWNFVVTAIRYMSDLLDIPVEIHSIWHAGHYDPSDMLGMRMAPDWSSHAELSWFHASDFNYFGTEYHRNMFLTNLNIPEEYHSKAIRSGQPHEYIIPELLPYNEIAKMRQIIWPHRYNSDKQPDIAEALSIDFHTIITQKQHLNKMGYYNILGVSRVMFSCSLHENLGVSIMEGVMAGVIPVLPDRCSYSEMYAPEFLYPSEWTESYGNFEKHRTELYDFITDRLDNPDKYEPILMEQKERLRNEYLSSKIMLDQLFRE